MMGGFKIAHYKCYLHYYRNNKDDIDVVDEGPNNHCRHDNNQSGHHGHDLPGLIIKGGHAWNLKSAFFKNKAENQEY